MLQSVRSLSFIAALICMIGAGCDSNVGDHVSDGPATLEAAGKGTRHVATCSLVMRVPRADGSAIFARRTVRIPIPMNQVDVGSPDRTTSLYHSLRTPQGDLLRRGWCVVPATEEALTWVARRLDRSAAVPGSAANDRPTAGKGSESEITCPNGLDGGCSLDEITVTADEDWVVFHVEGDATIYSDMPEYVGPPSGGGGRHSRVRSADLAERRGSGSGGQRAPA